MKYNLDLNDLCLFVQVIDAGNFSEASRYLGIPKTTISRRIAKLEKHLSSSLIQRNTRQFELTNIGQQFYDYCLEFVEKAQQVQDFINGQDQLAGTIKFSCPREMLDYHITPILLEFTQLYPNIHIQIENTNRSVDLIQERLDFAVRGRPIPLIDSDVVIRPFFLSKHYLVASPKLIKHPIIDLNELTKYPSLSWQSNQHIWSFEHKTQGKRNITYQPKLKSDNFFFLQKAVLSGIGIAALPEALVNEQLKSGDLISVVHEEWQLPQWLIHAAYNSRRDLQPSARLLLDFIVDKLADQEHAV